MPSVLNCVTAAAPHGCHHPWGHFSTAPFLPIASRGRFNHHEVTSAAACVNAPPPPPYIPFSRAGSALLGGLLRAKARAGLTSHGCMSMRRHMLAASAQSLGPQSWVQGRGCLSPPLLHKKHPNLALKTLARVSLARGFSPQSYAAADKLVGRSRDWVKVSTAKPAFVGVSCVCPPWLWAGCGKCS